MERFEIVDLLPLHRQMTLVIFRDPNTQKCKVQILTGDDAARVSVEVDEILSRKIMDWCEVRGILPKQLVRAFVCFCGEPENADIVKSWARREFVRSKIDIEKLPSVTREELERDVDAVMERVENGESPILIRSTGTTDLLLFGWEDYLRRFPTLYTPEEIAGIEAACLEIKETEAE